MNGPPGQSPPPAAPSPPPGQAWPAQHAQAQHGAAQAYVPEEPRSEPKKSFGESLGEAAQDKAAEVTIDLVWQGFVALLPSVGCGALAGAAAATVTTVVMVNVTRAPANQLAPEPAQTPAVQAPAPVAVAARGTLGVDSMPAGARVTLDGRLVGITPIAHLDVEPGTHAVALELAGHEPALANVEVREGGVLQHAVSLVPVTHLPTATVAVAPRSSGGRVAPVSSGPTRNCSSERSTCTSRCWSAENRCMPPCGPTSSCSSFTPDHGAACRQRVEDCQRTCRQLRQSCDGQCESSYDSCRASQ